MKSTIVITAIVGALFALPVFSASAQEVPQSASTGTGLVSSASSPATAQSGNWAPSYGHEKTRAEVRQELIQAQNDGQLKSLNSTLYFGS
ncbi:DUF4148 domain-containing protein [Paraburkholderia madseniana]|uniref:DUF4148 domain-containing protein n=1 Tax=Paraburkholderia madseniana TaxID=2599607 RepID=UPI00155970DA|nr:DUF4148 domain-containing protein [Paraburkholderia madseniana]NPT64267.1 DUF4148 domain-containing protein [Paraburkholderia madseniana]